MIKNANSVSEREWYEKIGYRIIQESAPVRSLREELVRAMRAGDTDRIGKVQLHIQHIRAEETNGASWGNDKGNKKRVH